MPLGPGKYDDLCSAVRTAARADGAVILVINGAQGNGFSAQVGPIMVRLVPAMLRSIADQIEAHGAAGPP